MTGHSIPRQDRWTRVWAIVTLAMLAVSLAICLADRGLPAQAKLAAIGLSGLWAAWYWLFVARSRSWRERLTVRVVSFAVSIVLAGALSRIHVIFVLLLFGYYGVAFGALPIGWAIPTVVLSSLVLAARFMDFRGGRPVADNLYYLFGFLGMAFVDAVLGLFITSIVRQSAERQRMIEEIAATRGELARAERAAGVIEERRRLAGEIHDTLAQGFTGIVLQLENAQAQADADPAGSRARVDRALTIARQSLAEARRALWALRPELLEREPFEAAIGRLARKWSETSGIHTETLVTGTPCPLPASVEVTLLRAAQEALANALKHADSRTVSLTLSYMEDQVAMDVQDDGKGFDVCAPARGFGLKGMGERVESLGGSLSVESAPGEGTTLVVQMPIQPPADQEVKT
jgi:signal transduction histidine kinase